MIIALVIIGLALVAALLLGIRARAGKDMTLEQWSVGGRGFGTIFVFLLSAGEIYTTFTLLGASGYAYGHGGPALYILSYGCLAIIMSYWLLPPIWRYGNQHHLISQPDFFARKYDSPALGMLVSLVGIIALVPYMVLQLKGLGIIVTTASYGSITPNLAIWIGAAAVTTYVMVSGVHGSAWTAVLKDGAILAVVVFLGIYGIYLPLHYYGGLGPMFAAIEQAKPGFLALPPRGESVAWFDSTLLLTAMGFYMWPHAFGTLYTARSDLVFRRNAIGMPLYQLILLFVLFIGFAAVLKVPGLTGGNIDLALFRLSIATFDPWFVGVIGAAGVLTALVPGSMILMTAATLLANNFYRAVNPAKSDAEISRVAKLMVPLVALLSVWFTLRGGETIVALLLMGYSFVTQLFPATIVSFAERRPWTSAGAIGGIAVGIATVAAITLSHTSLRHLFPGAPRALTDLNIGIVALAANIVVATVVSFVARPLASRRRA